MNPATGSAVLLALGPESEFGVPGASGVIAYRARLPIKAGLKGEEEPSGSVNQSGLVERGIPGSKGGGFEWPLPLRVGEMLEYFEHIFGACSKSTLEAGVYAYDFSPTVSGVDTSFYALYATPPVEHWWLYGIKFSSIELDIGDNEEIPVSMKGLVGHGTRLGAAVAAPGNTGTYGLGPYIRGPLKDRTAGPVHVEVSQVAGGLEFKVEQAAGAPSFAGLAVPVVLDPVTGRAVWQNLQGADGIDLGIWAENKDPLEVIWPGEPSDHADLEVGDRFTFPVEWTEPAVPFLSGHQRFTSAHWIVQLRGIGESAWVTKPVNTGKLSIEKAVTPERGATSRYPYAMTRDGRFMPTLELNRKFLDNFFGDRAERHERLEGRLLFEGRQLGTGAQREGLTLTYASLAISDADRSPANEKAIAEKLKLTAETNDSGDFPLVARIITTRNWTPST